ncbi:MAG: hypothetical protein GX060_08560 [Firmicutes bacterium]|nr:hypothetical protein [Bacillota bacterium]
MAVPRFLLTDLRQEHPDALAIIKRAETELAELIGQKVALVCYQQTSDMADLQPIH